MGLQDFLKTVKKIRSRVNDRLSVAGILLTMCDARTNLCKVITEQVRDTFEGQIRIFESRIPKIVHLCDDFRQLAIKRLSVMTEDKVPTDDDLDVSLLEQVQDDQRINIQTVINHSQERNNELISEKINQINAWADDKIEATQGTCQSVYKSRILF